jgi:hypothetical protein
MAGSAASPARLLVGRAHSRCHHNYVRSLSVLHRCGEQARATTAAPPRDMRADCQHGPGQERNNECCNDHDADSSNPSNDGLAHGFVCNNKKTKRDCRSHDPFEPFEIPVQAPDHRRAPSIVLPPIPLEHDTRRPGTSVTRTASPTCGYARSRPLPETPASRSPPNHPPPTPRVLSRRRSGPTVVTHARFSSTSSSASGPPVEGLSVDKGWSENLVGVG